MSRPPNDDQVRLMFEDLKHQDAAEAPTFEATLRNASKRRAWWRGPVLPVSLGLTLTGATAAAAVLVFFNVHGSSSAPAPSLTPVTFAQPISEPLSTLLVRPGRTTWSSFDPSPIPQRRLLGGWE